MFGEVSVIPGSTIDITVGVIEGTLGPNDTVKLLLTSENESAI